jgi:hypothetical protein
MHALELRLQSYRIHRSAAVAVDHGFPCQDNRCDLSPVPSVGWGAMACRFASMTSHHRHEHLQFSSMVSRDNGREPVAVSTATWSPGDTGQISLPERLDFAGNSKWIKKSRPANEAKAANIDQDHTIRFVHDVLCAAQKDSPGTERKR